MKQMRKLLALLLVVVLVTQIMPAAVFAEAPTRNSNIAHEEPETLDISEDSLQEAKEMSVVGEMPDRRGESEKHFRMSDGGFVAVDYGTPVHYTVDDGETWQEIDNTLVLTESKRGEAEAYTAVNGNATRGFAPDLRSGQLFSVADGSHALRMGLATDPVNVSETEVPSDEPATDSVISDEAGKLSVSSYNTAAAAEISYPDAKIRGDEPQTFEEQIAPKKLRTEVLYRDVWDGVDLSYLLCGYDVKETILVKEQLSDYSFTFTMDAEGLTPKLREDGSITLADKTGAICYEIPTPYMFDAAGAESYAAAYKLEQNASGAWSLTVVADADWINASDRVFPVSIDPTVIDKVSWTSQGFATTYVVQGAATATHTHYQNVYFGYTTYQSLKEHQIYVGTDNLPTIPPNCEVVKATYNLPQFGYSYVGAASMIAEVHEVSASKPTNLTNYDWIYGRCWNNKPTIDSTVLEYRTFSNADSGTYVDMDITSLVKKWYRADRLAGNNSSQNTRAFSIKLANVGSYNATNYAIAKFYGYGSSGPVLTVSYRDMTGIEPYYTYQTLSAGRAGAAYISDYSGALTTVTPLVSYASTVNPFALSLVYNSSYFKNASPDEAMIPSNLGYGMRMGSGFKLNILQKVEYDDLQYEVGSTATQRYIKYTDGDGTVHYFAPDADKQANEPSGSPTYYYDEDGLGLKISEYATNYFRMEDDKGNKMTFVHGFLTMIDDANGNRLRIWFSDSTGAVSGTGYPIADGYKPDHIKQVNKNQTAITVATFSYDNSDGANTLKSVTDAANNVVSFVYSNHKLRFVKRNGSAYVEFKHRYDESTNRYVNPVIGLTDSVSNYSLCFTYEESKIARFQEQVGAEDGAGATITRVLGKKTTYTDWGVDHTEGNADDISTTYLFDNFGRTVNAYSTDSAGKLLGATNAVYSGTGSTDKKNNRVEQTAGIGPAAMPMIRNGGFELSGSGLDWTVVKPENCGCFATVKTGELTRTGTMAFKTWVSSTATGPTGCSISTGHLNAGNTYTFSVYVNTSSATGFGTKGVYLRVVDSWTSYRSSDYLNYKTDAAIDGGWVKLSFSYTVQHTGSHTVYIYDEGVTGAVYYDDFQMEAGDKPSNVNLLDNGGLQSSAAGWLTESGAAATAESTSAIQGGKALKIIGSPTAVKHICQTVPINQPGTQTYVLSGWAKANAVPDNKTAENVPEEQDVNKQFGLRAVLTYSDNTKEYHYVPFNADVTDWQFASLAIVPKQSERTVSTIRVECVYEKNANTAYFDNLSLVKEVAQTMDYDEDGNLVSVKSTGTTGETATYENGNLTQVVTGGSGTFHYTYDDKHNLTEATNSTVKETYSYDSVGNVQATALTKATGGTAAKTINGSRTYTNQGNLVGSVTGATGRTTSFAYGTELSKMLGAATRTVDPKGTANVVNYLDDGRISSSWISSVIALNRTYNDRNQLTKLNRGGYNITGNSSTAYHQYYNFTYDSFGNTTGISIGPNGEYSLAAYSYAPKNGLLTQMTYGNGATVAYTYDELGRSAQTTTSSGDSYTYAYTGDGQLYELKDNSGNLLYRYTYDTLGRLLGSAVKSGNTTMVQTQHQYDNNNRLSKQTWNLSGAAYQESFAYDDNNGRLTGKTITLPGAVTAGINLGYDELSRVSQVSTPVATTELSYKAAQAGTGTTGLVSRMIVTPVQTGLNVFEPFFLTYEYDELGNLTQVSHSLQAGIIMDSLSYGYDNQSQLMQAVSSTYGTWNYQYDTFGNLRSQTHGTDAVSYTYGDAAWVDLLTAVSGTKNGTSFSGTFTYDGSGNPTNYYNLNEPGQWTMSWKNGRELATISNGVVSFNYDYDVSGLRTWKLVDGVRHDYIYASGKLMRETYTQDGTTYKLDFLYDQSGNPFMLNYTAGSTTTAYYYILNLQGDVLLLVDASGNEAASYTYDAWGNLLYSFGSMANVNPLRYRGYYFDEETGFYYLQSRYYDPALGRFINADSYASTGDGYLGYNMFAYCNNNPTNSADPSGEQMIRANSIAMTDGGEKHYTQEERESLVNPFTDYQDYSQSAQEENYYVKVTAVDEIPENAVVFTKGNLFTGQNYAESVVDVSITEVTLKDKSFAVFPRGSVTVYYKHTNVIIKVTVTITHYELEDFITAITEELVGIYNASGVCGGVLYREDILFPLLR